MARRKTDRGRSLYVLLKMRDKDLKNFVIREAISVSPAFRPTTRTRKRPVLDWIAR